MAARKAVKTVKNAILYDDGLIKVMNVRFSHPHLDAAYKGKDDKGVAKFSVTGMLPKSSHAAAKKLIEERIAEVMKENKVKALAADKKFLKDGDESDKPEYEGHWTISCREERRPPLRDIDKEIVDPSDAKEVFYGGCWGSILLRPWYQNNDFGKRVNSGLVAVRKSKDDEAFGEGRITDEEVDEAFDDEEAGDEEESRPARSSRSSGSRSSGRAYEDDDDDPDDL